VFGGQIKGGRVEVGVGVGVRWGGKLADADGGTCKTSTQI